MEILGFSLEVFGSLLMIFGYLWNRRVNFDHLRNTSDDFRHVVEFLRTNYGNLRCICTEFSFSTLCYLLSVLCFPKTAFLLANQNSVFLSVDLSKQPKRINDIERLASERGREAEKKIERTLRKS